MVCCCLSPSHYLNQWWPMSLAHYCITSALLYHWGIIISLGHYCITIGDYGSHVCWSKAYVGLTYTGIVFLCNQFHIPLSMTFPFSATCIQTRTGNRYRNPHACDGLLCWPDAARSARMSPCALPWEGPVVSIQVGQNEPANSYEGHTKTQFPILYCIPFRPSEIYTQCTVTSTTTNHKNWDVDEVFSWKVPIEIIVLFS